MRLSITILLALTLPTSLQAHELTAHGSFRHMSQTGDSTGTVSIDVLDVPQAWGVGALTGLKGEVVILDGRVLVSRGDDAQARLAPPAAGEQAAILAYGRVEAWQGVDLPDEMTPTELTAFIERKSYDFGLNPQGGFPLRLEGKFPTLAWHVVTGEPSVPAQEAKHKHQATHGGHANTRSGMSLFEEGGASGEIVGLYTGPALEGIASHPQERLHLHFVSSDGARSGHVDEIVFQKGTRLMLPVPATKHAVAIGAASPYRGMEQRHIKSLSEKDIDDLRTGRGWGLALPAELNGVPGPAHLLELKEQIGLSTDQVDQIQSIFKAMQTEAKAAGERFIAAEAAIEAAFRDGGVTSERLRALIEASAAAKAELRFVHLSRHIETPALLSEDQIARYNELRGYDTTDPCATIPEGHDAAMWKRHNNCE